MTRMKALQRLLGLVLLCALLASGPVQPARAQGPGFLSFDQSRHNLQGAFLDFYQQTPNAEELFGYPITEEFQSIDGQRVQYFQRARFELHVELPPGQQVVLTPLGRLTYVPGDQLPYFNTLGCEVFASGYPVCLAFLDFFNHNGGVARFGQPISAFEGHEGLIVQYFENVRLEWRPWMPEGQRVVIADLGAAYFKRINEDQGWLNAVPPLDNSAPRILDLQVYAFVGKAVTLPDDTQVVYIAVQDQTRSPVEGAFGEVVVQWADGRSSRFDFVCNAQGVAQVLLTVSGQPFGRRVVVRVNAATSDGVMRDKTMTSFRIWH